MLTNNNGKPLTKQEFKNIYDQYFDTIRNYIYYRCGNTELATDICQETFLRVWEKQFDINNGKIKSLLYKIANDKFISTIRHQKIIDDSIPEIKFRYFSNTSTDDELEEQKRKYEKALGNLPEKQRVVFLMNKLDGHTYKEIAHNLNLSVKAVEKRMSMALKSLRNEVKAL